MMQDWLSARVRATPQATAVVMGDRQWTYAALDELAAAVVQFLRPYVTPGARIAVLLPNDLPYVALVHALARIGAILVPLNTRLTRGELAAQLQQARPILLITDVAGRQSLGNLGQKVVVLPDLAELPPLDAGPSAESAAHLLDPSATQSIIFTSGTTGRSKGAMLTFANHLASATASAFRLGVLPQDRWLSCLPLYHVGGLAVILRSCLYGTAVVLHERFDEAAISRSLDTQDITLISLVPTMVRRLLAERGGRPWPNSLRHVLVGGAAMPPELTQACLDLGIPISTTYGLTEAASQVATLTAAGLRQKPGSAGRPLLFNTVTICDSAGKPLPAGQHGEIVVSGPVVMAGYFEDQQATSTALRDGRLFTGDMGYLDADGDLFLLQRRSDLIISGGENIYPGEVEAVLEAHPAVLAACVLGLPDLEWGQRVAAAVVAAPDLANTDLEDHCRRHLAGYKVPRQFFRLEQLPLTSSGKVARQALLDQMLLHSERDEDSGTHALSTS